MDLSWTVDEIAGASLVRCLVHNDDAVSRRMRIEGRFDAPVLPPRRAGVPEPGWDATGVTLRLDPDERRGVGFAVPAPPVEPPVRVVDGGDAGDGGPAFGAASADRSESGPSGAADALWMLADHRPPRAAVEGGEMGIGDGSLDDDPDAHADDPDAVTDGGDECDADETPPVNAIDDWFAAVESRLDPAERLTDADVETATELVAEAGGVDALADLDERVAADAKRLRAVGERASALAERAEATDAPIAALERLA
ncbi:hypothetical protein U4E84_16445 [Halorubrum sp. AD140]|uniref:DUF7857 domain-containing protein n=1 Tax=Halorubrum sp. AD140 TaxID=3050073 RepID=UPI002ACC81ED|nr:hypothetical protein [Halorubrum sp. AD140]MDZ5812931.1 hypothetical protein [Halorubrum sp. AD140]